MLNKIKIKSALVSIRKKTSFKNITISYGPQTLDTNIYIRKNGKNNKTLSVVVLTLYYFIYTIQSSYLIRFSDLDKHVLCPWTFVLVWMPINKVQKQM